MVETNGQAFSQSRSRASSIQAGWPRGAIGFPALFLFLISNMIAAEQPRPLWLPAAGLKSGSKDGSALHFEPSDREDSISAMR